MKNLKRLKKTLRLVLPLLIFFVIISCNNEEEFLPQERNLNSIQKISLSDDPYLQNLLRQQKSSQSYQRASNDFLSNLNFEEILKIINAEEKEIKYTLTYNSGNSGTNFKNLYIREKNDSVSFFIMIYKPSKEWLLSERSNSWNTYTGGIEGYDLNGTKVSSAEVEDGRISNVQNNKSARIAQSSLPPLPIAPGCYDLVYIQTTGNYFWAEKPCDEGLGGTDSGSGSDGSSSDGGGTSTGDTSGTGGNGEEGLDDPDQYEDYPIGGGMGALPTRLTEEERAELWRDMIDQINNPEEKRKEQLKYIATHNAQAGRDFKDNIESLIATPGITRGEVDDINKIVNDYWEELVGRYIMEIFLPVAEAAKPFVELALIETGTGVLFQAVKGLLSVKWGVQLAKIGINTTSIANVVNRMKSGLSFGLNNSSLALKIGGRNLFGTANSSKKAYNFTNVTSTEAKAIFQDMTVGRQVKRFDMAGGKYRETVFWRDAAGNRNSITFRNYSSSGQIGQPTIDVNMIEIRNINLELKFFP